MPQNKPGTFQFWLVPGTFFKSKQNSYFYDRLKLPLLLIIHHYFQFESYRMRYGDSFSSNAIAFILDPFMPAAIKLTVVDNPTEVFPYELHAAANT